METEKKLKIQEPIDESKEKVHRSIMPIRKLSLYDPYDFRDEMGHLTNFQAWAHMVKCSLGTGVLTMPMGFKHAGLIPGLVIGVVIASFCVYCMHILIKSAVHIAGREQIPYMPFGETMKYTFSHGYPACRPLSKCIQQFTDVILVMYHFGICIAFVNYMTQTTMIIWGHSESREGYNLPTLYCCIIWLPFICIINCIRNLKLLAPISMAGNILTAASMSIITYFIFQPGENGRIISDDWKYFGNLETIPLYIGIILFAVEAFGVIIAIERDMKTPKKFLGWFGIFNLAMVIVVLWYLFLGLFGYLRYGSKVQSAISFAMDPNYWVTKVMYIMLCLSLYCSYPLHCFVCIDILWNNQIRPKLNKRKLFWEYCFRCSTVLVSCLASFLVPKLDLLVSLVGSICLSFLGIMMPGIMEYNVAWSKYGAQWSCMMVKDVLIVLLGFSAFFIGTYGSLYSIAEPILKH